jgi:hypothetical protein
MTESELRHALALAADRAIPADSLPLTDPVAAIAARPVGRPRRRLKVALALGLALASLSAAGVLAVATGTLPVEFHLRAVGPATQPIPSDKAAIEKQAAAAAGPAKDATSAGSKVEPPAVAMTLAGAQAALGVQLLVAPDQAPRSVLFKAASSEGQTKPGAPSPSDVVQLTYAAGGSTVTVEETRDSTDRPLTIDAANADGPALKTDGGLGRAAIETVAGNTYAVGYSVDGGFVVWVIFKSASGVDVTVHFQPGVTHEAALAFATSLR